MQDLDVKKSKMLAFFCVSWCEKSDVTQKSAVRNTPHTKYLQNRPNLVYICTKFQTNMYYKLIREQRDGKAVRGHIYSVEHRYSGSAGIYQEYLTPIAPTLENADCMIPALIYKTQVTRSPKFGKLLPELVQVPGRTGIRIHYGTKPGHSKGCILITNHEICARFTNTLLVEQQNKEPIYLEIYETGTNLQNH